MKPLTLEEAKANIGKEVYLLPHTKPYGYTSLDGTHESENLNYNNIIGKKIILVSVDDEYDVNVRPFDCDKAGSLEVIAMRHISLAEPLKIGDTVKLDPSTKPYTVINWNGELVEKRYFHEDSEEHTITAIHADGDILIDNMGYIQPRHLIKVEEKTMTADQLIERNNVQDESTSVGALHIDVEVGVSVTENKKHYTPEEVELRERIAIELLRQQNRHPNDIDLWFNAITGQ